MVENMICQIGWVDSLSEAIDGESTFDTNIAVDKVHVVDDETGKIVSKDFNICQKHLDYMIRNCGFSHSGYANGPTGLFKLSNAQHWERSKE